MSCPRSHSWLEAGWRSEFRPETVKSQLTVSSRAEKYDVSCMQNQKCSSSHMKKEKQEKSALIMCFNRAPKSRILPFQHEINTNVLLTTYFIFFSSHEDLNICCVFYNLQHTSDQTGPLSTAQKARGASGPPEDGVLRRAGELSVDLQSQKKYLDAADSKIKKHPHCCSRASLGGRRGKWQTVSPASRLSRDQACRVSQGSGRTRVTHSNPAGSPRLRAQHAWGPIWARVDPARAPHAGTQLKPPCRDDGNHFCRPTGLAAHAWLQTPAQPLVPGRVCPAL